MLFPDEGYFYIKKIFFFWKRLATILDFLAYLYKELIADWSIEFWDCDFEFFSDPFFEKGSGL